MARALTSAGLVLAALVAGTAPARLAAAQAQAVRYTIRDLGTLGGPEARLYDFSEDGQAAGFAQAAQDGEGYPIRPVIWHDGEATDLRTPAGPLGIAEAINSRGQAAGYYEASTTDRQGNPVLQAFWWDGATRVDLPGLGGSRSGVRDINESGQVVGWSTPRARRGQFAEPRAVLWEGGVVKDLGTLGGPSSEAVDINNHGQVVGNSTTGEKDAFGYFIRHAFLWQDGEMVALGLPGRSTHATGINDRGQVVGYFETGERTENGFLVRHACKWVNGQLIDLGSLGGSSYGYFINEQGQVAGSSDFDVTIQNAYHAVLWDGEEMIDLGTFGGDRSKVTDLNDLGQVVGYADDGLPNGYSPAFLWENGQLHRLDELVAPGAGWDLEEPLINNQGQIAVWGTRGFGRRVALLTPVPPDPADLSLQFSADRTQVTGRASVTLTATVTNHGPNPALDVDTVISGSSLLYQVTSVTTDEGTYQFFYNSSFATGLDSVVRWGLPRLEPGASATIQVVVRPFYTGTHEVEATVGSGDDYNAANNHVAVPITSELDPRPDLQGAWERVVVRRAGRWQRLQGVVQVADLGAGTASSSFRVRAYLSEDAVPDDTDLLFKEVQVRDLTRGEARVLRIKARVSRKTRVAGRYMLLVVDSAGEVDEQLEDNNVAVLKLE